jgi:1,4-alpha-glucan branching enzyme
MNPLQKLSKTILAVLVLAALSAQACAQSIQHFSGQGPWVGSLIVEHEWKYFSVDVEGQHGELKWFLVEALGNFEIYYKQGSIPTQSNYDYKKTFTGPIQGGDATLTNQTTPKLTNGRMYVGVYAARGCKFRYRLSRNVVPSHIPGMGSIPSSEGTSFRTYAPNATSVHAAGQFNNWNDLAAPLQSEGNGYRSVFFRGATPGQQYKYVIRNGNQTLWKTDPYSQQLTNSVGNSVIFDQNAFAWDSGSYSTPTWNNTVIYEMHIGTFNDSPGGAPGTFYTAIQRLDYLKDLGINAIELLPVNEFPGDFSWGYNQSYPFSVEAAYGGPQGLKTFINECHKRGIAVLLDVVHNHYGPNDLDLWQYDGWSQNGRGGIFFYQDERANTPWGDTRPDFGRGFVRQYIRDNAIMWLEDFRVDGLRWDSTLNIRTTNWGDNPDGWSLMQWINDEINARQPWKLSISEDLQNNAWLTKTTGSGGAGFDSQWSPNFVHPIRPVLTNANDSDRDMNSVVTALTDGYNGEWLQRVIYTESHDEVANGRSRVPQEIDSGNPGSYWARKRSTLGAALMFTSPGIPMLFQGQEILEDGYFQDTDPIDWNKLVTFSGVNLLYKDLVKLRLNKTGQTAGLSGPNLNVFHVNHGAKVVAFHRYDQGGPGDDVVVLMNFSNTSFSNYTIGLPRSGTWTPVFNSDWNGYGSDYLNTFTAPTSTQQGPFDGLPFKGTFALGPYTCVILVQSQGGNQPARNKMLTANQRKAG